MTGYALTVEDFANFTIHIEIKSLNSKFLELRFRLPSSLEYMEHRMRQILKQKVRRGKVDTSVKITAKEQFELSSLQSMVEKYSTFLKMIERRTNTSFKPTITEIISLKSTINPGEEVVEIPIPDEKFEELFINTVNSFQESRLQEGEQAKRDIIEYLDMIERSLVRVEIACPEVVERYRATLKERIKELLENKIDETRLMMEVGIFASKVDICEEVSRVSSHIHKMKNTMRSDGACGRELDFIIQEINREINTIGSKVPDYKISEEVVNMKTNLEKIKEQVRNIE